MTNWPSITRHSAKSLPRRPLVLAMSTPGGCLTNTPQALQKYTHNKKRPEITSTVRASSRNPACVPNKKHVFGHTYKEPAWNPHKKYDFRTTQTSRGHYESLVNIPCRLIEAMDLETVHYSDVIMGTMASLITSLTSVYSTVHSYAD